MNPKTRNIIIISSVVLVLGVGAYFFFKNRNKNGNEDDDDESSTGKFDKNFKTIGKDDKNWEDLKRNLGKFLPRDEIKLQEKIEDGAKNGDKLAEKIFPYHYFGIVDTGDVSKVKIRISTYYYADGDFRSYVQVKSNDFKTDDNWLKFMSGLKNTFTLKVAQGEWLNKNGTKVKIEPTKLGTEMFKIKKGTYEGADVKQMLSRIYKKPVGYYNPDSKIYEI